MVVHSLCVIVRLKGVPVQVKTVNTFVIKIHVYSLYHKVNKYKAKMVQNTVVKCGTYFNSGFIC